MTPGKLLIGATPLGRPDDASARLVEALKTADIVAAEDTRRVRGLAQSLGVQPAGRILSFFDQNEVRARAGPGRGDRGGRDGAGGERRGHAVDQRPRLPPGDGVQLEAGWPVSCLPGPSAVTTALAVSGLASDRFCFEGFAPRKHAARLAWLRTLAAEPRTTVFFESPRRLAETLRDAVEVLGPSRRAVVCRELTKTHEEIRRGSLGELAEWAADGVLGEITVVLAGGTPTVELPDLVAEVEELVADGIRVKDACAQVIAANPGAPSRRELYDAVLRARD